MCPLPQFQIGVGSHVSGVAFVQSLDDLGIGRGRTTGRW
jgi:hypothetical protein